MNPESDSTSTGDTDGWTDLDVSASATWQNIFRELLDRWPIERWATCDLWVGCSGGADSVALAVALAFLRQTCVAPRGQTRGQVGLLHVNHNLRGEASDRDESFTRQLAFRLKALFRSVRLSGLSADEASLRSAREQVFTDVAHETGARYVAVAHTADDNAETLLHNLFRGTGPSGLAGIAPFRPLGPDAVLARPLLHIPRQTLREALTECRIPWREDASNLDESYSRNWIRHQIRPLIESRYPDAFNRIAGAAENQREWRDFVRQQSSLWLDAVTIEPTPPNRIWLRRDLPAPRCLIIDAMHQLWDRQHWPRGSFTSDHWRQLASTWNEHSGPLRMTLPGAIDVNATATKVRIERDCSARRGE